MSVDGSRTLGQREPLEVANTNVRLNLFSHDRSSRCESHFSSVGHVRSGLEHGCYHPCDSRLPAQCRRKQLDLHGLRDHEHFHSVTCRARLFPPLSLELRVLKSLPNSLQLMRVLKSRSKSLHRFHRDAVLKSLSSSLHRCAFSEDARLEITFKVTASIRFW